jgi:hypothetical protein
MKKPRTAFIEIIKQLEPLDVRILKELFELYNGIMIAKEQRWGKVHTEYKISDPSEIELNTYKFRKSLSIDDESYWAAVDNLQRLGLCRSYIEVGSVENTLADGDTEYSDVVSFHGGHNFLYITTLGLDFVKICTYADLAGQQVPADAA